VKRIDYWLTTPIEKLFSDYGAKPDGFIYLSRGPKVLAVAHLDTRVQKLWPFHIEYDNLIVHPGLDDRLGAWVIMDVLPQKGIEVDVLLTSGEESAQSSAALFKNADQYNWIVEFDRRGEDVVTYGMESAEWLDALGDAKFKTDFGSFSDLCFLNTKKCAVNVGIGYHGEHSQRCYCEVEELRRQIARFKKFYFANKDKEFVQNEKAQMAAAYEKLARRNYYQEWSQYHGGDVCEYCEEPLVTIEEQDKGLCNTCLGLGVEMKECANCASTFVSTDDLDDLCYYCHQDQWRMVPPPDEKDRHNKRQGKFDWQYRENEKGEWVKLDDTKP